MFSTLLGPLPSGVTLADLVSIGIELPADGTPAARPDADRLAIVDRWRAAAASTDRPVKQVLAGPYSAGRDGRPSHPAALAESLRAAVIDLAAAGCPFVEIDEPDALAIAVVPAERRRFVDAHRRLVDGLSGIHVSLALTGGSLDGAGPSTFFDLAYQSYAFDLISGPDNWRLITAAPHDRGIVCGALDPAPTGDETPELLVWAAGYAASTAGRGIERIGLANAQSLASLPADVALRKLRRVVEASGIAALTSIEEIAASLDPRAFGGRRNRPGRVRLGEGPG